MRCSRNLTPVRVNLPVVKSASFYAISLKGAKPIDNTKWDLLHVYNLNPPYWIARLPHSPFIMAEEIEEWNETRVTIHDTTGIGIQVSLLWKTWFLKQQQKTHLIILIGSGFRPVIHAIVKAALVWQDQNVKNIRGWI